VTETALPPLDALRVREKAATRELDAIAAAVIGGTVLTGAYGYVLGSVIGALVLGLMNVLITRDGGIPPEMTTIITGGILLVFVLLQRVVTRKRE
jgi:simple sugar transport system permease protein